MCGIIGQFCWQGPTTLDPAFVDFLQHRGPDEGAYWRDGPFFLGHRRLSIIDLASGQQPMATQDGEVVVTSNGEIYNYPELRNELSALGHSFQTRSDTEVLLHGYRQWGTGLPAKLIGMFAFAIADRSRRELFLARDRFGEKPLFYLDRPGDVIFASEVRAFAALPGFPKTIEAGSLAAFLCLNYIPGDSTLLRGVMRLPSGTWRLYTASGYRTDRYWEPRSESTAQTIPSSQPEASARLSDLFDNAVKLTLQSDVPVGVFLSGGIDSSLVAESAVRQGGLSRAFCLDFAEEGFSEYPKAKLVADRLGIPLIRAPLSHQIMERFLDITSHADDPLADSSAIAVWAVSHEAAKHNKVVLGGDGGDELFAGYLTYQASALHRKWISHLPGPFRRLMARVAPWIPCGNGKVSFGFKLMRFLRAADLATQQAHYTWNGTWLPQGAALLLRDPQTASLARNCLEQLAQRHHLRSPTLRALQYVDLMEYLPNDILAKVDRMSMANGLEVRAPFLEPTLAAFALDLPDRMKLGSTPKVILRDKARALFGPAIADAPKQGFSIPVHSWIRRYRGLAEDLLSPASVESIGHLDPAKIRAVVDAHMGGRHALGWEIWGLMVLSAWHRSMIASRPRPDINRTAVVTERSFPQRTG
jgi:asparagine synthase (glutamine-hydrolysing)